jgi:hypothetical protein
MAARGQLICSQVNSPSQAPGDTIADGWTQVVFVGEVGISRRESDRRLRGEPMLELKGRAALVMNPQG